MKSELIQIAEPNGLCCPGHSIQIGRKGELATVECSCGVMIAVSDTPLNPASTAFDARRAIALEHIEHSRLAA